MQAYYHWTKDPVFHQVVYAILTAIILFRSMWVMESQLRPALKTKSLAYAKDVLRTMWQMIATGMSGLYHPCEAGTENYLQVWVCSWAGF